MKIILLIGIVSLLYACKPETEAGNLMNADVSSKLDIIASHKIYFGHQSVGENILMGFSEIISLNKHQKIQIVNLHRTTKLPGSYLAHSYIGHNKDAASKCEDFSKTIKKYFASDLDIALMKFCFVDICRENNAQEIFNLYKTTIDRLKLEFPEITFIHSTVPLESEDVNLYWGVRRWIKKILGKRDYSPLDNVKRNEYNRLIREYFKNDYIFDIARVESTYPDGKNNLFNYNGKAYQSLIFDYSTDAAHLNEMGQKRAALEFISILVQACNDRNFRK